MGKRADFIRSLKESQGPLEKLISLEEGLKRVEGKLKSRVTVQTITPFLLTCYIEGQNKVFAYIPISCSIDSVYFAVDSINTTEPQDKRVVTASIKIATLTSGVGVFDWPGLKVGHVKKEVKQDVVPPAKVTISFDKSVNAWMCIVAYPALSAVRRENLVEG